MTKLVQTEINSILDKYAPYKCWKMGLYYGSTIYFDFNDRVKKQYLKGGEYEVGSTSLCINAYEWCFEQNNQLIIDSYEVNRNLVEFNLSDRVSGQFLDTILLYKNKLEITFSGSFKIRCPIPNDEEMELDDDYFSLVLPDGRFVSFNEKEGYNLDDSSIDKTRSNWWSKK